LPPSKAKHSAGVKVRGPRLKNYGGFEARGRYNNVWLTAARALGSPMTSFGEPGWSTGPFDFIDG
jgi:hypothetical protein